MNDTIKYSGVCTPKSWDACRWLIDELPLPITGSVIYRQWMNFDAPERVRVTVIDPYEFYKMPSLNLCRCIREILGLSHQKTDIL